MISEKMILVVISIALLAIQSGHSLECYSCDSSKGMNCNYGLLSFTYSATECKLNSGSGLLDTLSSIIPSNCVKLVGKDHEGNTYTARGCAPAAGTGTVCKGIAKLLQFADSQDIEELDCFTCDTDKCNSATTLGVGGFLFALITASFAFLF